MTEQIIQQQTSYNVLLIGDVCIDTYVYGTVDRISPEAPVPIFVPKYEIVKDGMAGNVRKNLEALGCKVNFLHGNVSDKKRIIDERSKQQLLRIDKDVLSDPVSIVSEIPPIYDAIVISDYNKGSVSYELVEELRNTFVGHIFVDTKKTDLARFNGCYVKINELERKSAVSLPDPEWVITTLGGNGAMWDGWVFPAEVAGDVTDVCGAGDTFLSALTYEYLNKGDIRSAIKFAIRASAITVTHSGVYAPRLEEIKRD